MNDDERDDDASSGKAAPRPTRGLRPNGRAARVVADVLDATFEELAVAGYGGLRVDNVARRSGVNKTTIYRRWPTKHELVAAAVAHAVPPVASVALGDVRAELLVMTRHSVAWFSSDRGRGLARMMLVEGADPEVQALVQDLKQTHRAPRLQVIQEAMDRGQLPADTDPGLLVDLLQSYLFAKVVRAGVTVGEAELARLVDLVLAGARGMRWTPAPEG